MFQKAAWIMAALAASALFSVAFAEPPAACQVIQQELALYVAEGGRCACPYSAAHDGHACGARSAWSKRQGASPRCYVDEAPERATASRWPDPPVCDVAAAATRARTDETRTAALPSSE